MKISPNFKYEFYSVGQGLFSSGHLFHEIPDNWNPTFNWVYDCGTSSAVGLLDKSILKLEDNTCFTRKDSKVKGKLGLVAISHFDRDHISGISKLIENFKIDTIILPYMNLYQRLLVAFAEGVDPRGNDFNFFIDPIIYLNELALKYENPIDRFLFIPASEGRSVDDFSEVDIRFDSDSGSYVPQYDYEDRPEGIADDPMFLNDISSTRLMSPRSSIRANEWWEFVPYNDASKIPVSCDFASEVDGKKNCLLNSTTRVERDDALIQIKDIYDKEFGSDGKNRNIISLFLYAGPIMDCCPNFIYDRNMCGKFLGHKPSLLYTGDGYLNEKSQLEKLALYLGHRRMGQIGVFQVMHHGSDKNWYKGVAEEIAPNVSVFSSDPTRKKPLHPNPNVLRDFWNYGPMQADKKKGVSIIGGCF